MIRKKGVSLRHASLQNRVAKVVRQSQYSILSLDRFRNLAFEEGDRTQDSNTQS